MILMNKFASKLKQVTANAIRVRFNHVVFGVCCVALLWLGWRLNSAHSHVPHHLRKYLQFPEHYTIPETQLGKAELEKLIFKVEHLNSQADVFNWYKYDPVYSTTTIIVICVHKDVERLQYLIISLGQVRYIWRVLLIFSHSYFDDDINYLVKSIDFCKVLQIFYPNSVQLYPKQFPGIDPDDCNATLGAGPAPTGPCFERDALRSQYKQHWWWTANYVFYGEWSSDKRMVIFLEEDNYVLPDLLHILHRTRNVLPFFPTVEVMSFGGPYPGQLDHDMVMIESWTPLYGKGLAFNLTTWQKISARSSFYCFYDDCEWSYSLVPVFENFSSGVAEMAACSAPRVLSTSGFVSGRRGALRAWSAAQRAALFPKRVRATVTEGAVRFWRARLEGRCADLRDQILCLDTLMAATTETTTDLNTSLSTEHANKVILDVK